MVVDRLEVVPLAEHVRYQARVGWEDSQRSDDLIWFDIPAQYRDASCLSAETFVLAVAAPALLAGEQRIRVDGEVCRLLVQGLSTALAFLNRWSPKANPRGTALPVIEAAERMRCSVPADRATGCFLSGGVDSLYLLHRNLTQNSPGSPGRVRYAIMVHGFDIGGRAGTDAGHEVFDGLVRGMRRLVRSHEIEVVPVRTNVRSLNDGVSIWGTHFHGPALSAVGHCFFPAISHLLLASTGSPLRNEKFPAPFGTHPMIDYHFSSRQMGIVDQWADVSRLERVAALATWPKAIDELRVCFRYWKTTDECLNCGVCEKCIRTKLGILAVGGKVSPASFHVPETTVHAIEDLHIDRESLTRYYREMIEPLEASGNRELAQAVTKRLEAWERDHRWRTEQNWSGPLKRWDRKHLGGTIYRGWRRITGS